MKFSQNTEHPTDLHAEEALVPLEFLRARENHLGGKTPDQSAFQGFRLVGEMFLSK